jgi:hypothetical protein
MSSFCVEKNDLLVETEGRYIRVEIVGSRDTELVQIIIFFLLLTLRLKILSIFENEFNVIFCSETYFYRSHFS